MKEKQEKAKQESNYENVFLSTFENIIKITDDNYKTQFEMLFTDPSLSPTKDKININNIINRQTNTTNTNQIKPIKVVIKNQNSVINTKYNTISTAKNNSNINNTNTTGNKFSLNEQRAQTNKEKNNFHQTTRSKNFSKDNDNKGKGVQPVQKNMTKFPKSLITNLTTNTTNTTTNATNTNKLEMGKMKTNANLLQSNKMSISK